MMEKREEILEKIRKISKSKEPCVVAIDGRCGAGKTTLATYLQGKLGCDTIHMDDFFLQSYQRTEKRLAEAGGNIDYERFLEEVLKPLQKGEPFSYQVYDCQTQKLGARIMIKPQEVVIIEGSYACHPHFREYYNYRIFLDIDSNEQYARIVKRNGKERAIVFKETWIPLEESYFSLCRVSKSCDDIYEIT